MSNETPVSSRLIFWVVFFALAAATTFLLVSCPAGAQAPPDEGPPLEPLPVEEQGEPAISFKAAVWCPLVSDDEDDLPPCDAGFAVALERWKKTAAVAAVGTETVGLGLAWVAGETREGRTVAVSIGVVASWDEAGIHTDTLAPAVGATITLARRR